MKFHIHTYGCQMNVRDSEAVEALMLAAGHERAAGEADADVVIVNSCTVRQKAEEKAVGKAGNLIAAKKVTGLMGCAVKRLGADVFKLLPKLLWKPQKQNPPKNKQNRLSIPTGDFCADKR